MSRESKQNILEHNMAMEKYKFYQRFQQQSHTKLFNDLVACHQIQSHDFSVNPIFWTKHKKDLCDKLQTILWPSWRENDCVQHVLGLVGRNL